MSSHNSTSPADADAKAGGIKLQRETPPEELRKMLDDVAKERLRKQKVRELLVAARERAEAR
ncbi:hypothetical protein COL516b_012540 [Colletotrichum fioriniae]|nr:uncharacterized protein COL516b_012540 [Colletotrichum fioriniae]KAJ0295494.1 hypothetical protein COL516b_012540 [Colletotrichum fioriniae]